MNISYNRVLYETNKMDKEKNKPEDTNAFSTKTFVKIIVILLVLAAIASASILYREYKIETTDDKECIVYGSIQHRVAYATDYNIAAWIKRNGHELGPYFNYNFCEEGE